MTYVLFGYFDERKKWDINVEQKILNIIQKRYKVREGKGKGCIARILNEEKNEKVKQIQRPVKEEIKLGIRRENGIGTEERKKRRKRGAVYVNVNIQNSNNVTSINNTGNDMTQRIRNAIAGVSGLDERDIQQLITNLTSELVGI